MPRNSRGRGFIVLQQVVPRRSPRRRVEGFPAGAAALLSLPTRATAPPALGAPTLPSGFVLRDRSTGQGGSNLTDFGYLPNGSILTIGRKGNVAWLPEAGRPRTIAHLRTDTTGDLGLVGLGIAPDYQLSGHIYLIGSTATPSAPPYQLRLSRFTVRGTGARAKLTHEKVLLRIADPVATHGMTTVLPARDGTLWVSFGDLRTFERVVRSGLNTFRLYRAAGKLLHLTADLAAVPTNPYYDARHPFSWRSRVYANSFRSPLPFPLDPATGRPIVGDVGWKTWEEIDLVSRGRNYKRTCWEGPAMTPGYAALPACANVPNTRPLWSYRHGVGSRQGNTVTGGIGYRGTRYPRPYRNAYFVGEFLRNKLWTMRIGGGRLVRRPQDPPFGTYIGAPVSFAAALNGDIVFADYATGDLRRLRYGPR